MKTTIAFFVILFIFLGIRFYGFNDYFELVSDNGTELAVVAAIKQGQCFPKIGPLLSANGIYIPPTYFYLLFVENLIFSRPLLLGYFSSLLQLSSVGFLMAVIWQFNQKRVFLVSFIFLATSLAFFAPSRLIWHPNPVEYFLSASLFLLIYAKKYQYWQALVGSLLTFWFATSIYPSTLLLVIWYVIELIIFLRAKNLNWLKTIFLSLIITALTALPFYFSQLWFELANNLPTMTALWKGLNSTQINSPISFTTLISNFQNFYDRFLILMLGIIPGFKWFWLEKLLISFGLLSLIILSVIQKGHTWLTRFPYLFLGFGLINTVFLQLILPDQFYPHQVMPVLIILILSISEALTKLKTSKAYMAYMISIVLVIILNNLFGLRAYFSESAVFSPESLSQKQIRMEKLGSFMNTHALIKNKTLILDHTAIDTTYDNIHDLQFDAMDNWYLLENKTLMPQLNSTCNQYQLFEAAEVQELAANIILIEPRQLVSSSPETLFQTFRKKTTIDLSDHFSAIWYTK